MSHFCNFCMMEHSSNACFHPAHTVISKLEEKLEQVQKDSQHYVNEIRILRENLGEVKDQRLALNQERDALRRERDDIKRELEDYKIAHRDASIEVVNLKNELRPFLSRPSPSSKSDAEKAGAEKAKEES